MGLDMFCRKISRIPEEEVKAGFFDNKIPMYFPNLLALSQEDINDEPDMYHDILPYLTKVNMVTSKINYDLMKLSQGIPQNAVLTGFSHSDDRNAIRFSLENGERKELVYTESEWNRSIEYDIQPTYIAYENESQYWRKEYGLETKLIQEYKARATLIQSVIHELEHSYYTSSWRNTFGVTNNLEGLDIRHVAKMMSKEIDLEPQFAPLIFESRILEILQDIKNLGLEHMRKQKGDILNCGYHAMNYRMARLSNVDYQYKNLDRKNEILTYKEWY